MRTQGRLLELFEVAVGDDGSNKSQPFAAQRRGKGYAVDDDLALSEEFAERMLRFLAEVFNNLIISGTHRRKRCVPPLRRAARRRDE